MIEQSLKSSIKSTKAEEIQVVYRLTFINALYSLECFVEGSNDSMDYCFIENFTDDEGEAEAFLKKIVKGKVLPVHIKDMTEDIFRK
jgi:hypothetical protein